MMFGSSIVWLTLALTRAGCGARATRAASGAARVRQFRSRDSIKLGDQQNLPFIVGSQID
jgi:hypothetical protein